jgi:hypothetical protein
MKIASIDLLVLYVNSGVTATDPTTKVIGIDSSEARPPWRALANPSVQIWKQHAFEMACGFR